MARTWPRSSTIEDTQGDGKKPKVGWDESKVEDDKFASLDIQQWMATGLTNAQQVCAGINADGGAGSLALRTNLGNFVVATANKTALQAQMELAALASPVLGGYFDPTNNSYNFLMSPGESAYATLENHDIGLDSWWQAAPVPEPASVGVLAIGSASLLLRRRRRT